MNRISGIKDALEAALEPLKDDIAEVRVGIVEKDDELDEGEDYHLAVFFVVDEDVWDGDVEGREAIHAAFAEFTAELNGCRALRSIWTRATWSRVESSLGRRRGPPMSGNSRT